MARMDRHAKQASQQVWQERRDRAAALPSRDVGLNGVAMVYTGGRQLIRDSDAHIDGGRREERAMTPIRTLVAALAAC